MMMRRRLLFAALLTASVITYGTAFATGTGFWLGDDNGTPKFSIGNAAGNHMTWDGSVLRIAGALGSVTIASGGHIRQGQTSYNSGGSGFWLGDHGGVPKFSIGNPSGNHMTWDGTQLTVNAKQVSGMLVHPLKTICTNGQIQHLNNTGNDYNTISYIGFQAGCGFNTELATIANGVVGQTITINHRGEPGTTVIIRHNWDGTPKSFRCPGNANVVLNVGGSITAQYDGTWWYVLTVNAG